MASFLVPTTSFPSEGRTVKCAKCGHIWKEIPVSKPHKEDPAARPAPQPLPLPEKLIKKESAKPSVTPAPPESAPAKMTIGRLNKLILIATAIMALFIALFCTAFVAGHGYIIKQWPELQQLYVVLGMAENPLKDNILLENITSERRYMDGAMHLHVQGFVTSLAEKRQVIPPIAVEALGPDGRVIESWRIEPPKATIDPGTSISFSSSVLSPEGTVTEVNLSFVEPPHDEP